MNSPRIINIKALSAKGEILKRKLSKIPMSIKGSMGLIEKASGERIIAGYASIIEIDSEDHFIPKETLEKGITTILDNPEYANLMLTHQNIQVGKLLNTWKELETHVDENGLFIIAEIRKDINIANEIWKKILNGDLCGFSIAAEVLLDHEECNDDKCITVIDKMNVFEISVCSEPINEGSGFVVISKSKCKKCDNNTGEVMSNTEKKVEVPQEEVIEESKDVDKPQEEVIEESKDDEEEHEECTEKSMDEPETLSIENLGRQVESLKQIVEQLVSKSDEESEKPEEVVEASEDVEEPKEEVIKESKDTQDFATKEDIKDIKKSISELVKAVSDTKEFDEMKTVLKSKDDEISALSERIKVIEKAEVKQKTIVKPEDKTSIGVDSDFVHDNLRPGTFYKQDD